MEIRHVIVETGEWCVFRVKLGMWVSPRIPEISGQLLRSRFDVFSPDSIKKLVVICEAHTETRQFRIVSAEPFVVLYGQVQKRLEPFFKLFFPKQLGIDGALTPQQLFQHPEIFFKKDGVKKWSWMNLRQMVEISGFSSEKIFGEYSFLSRGGPDGNFHFVNSALSGFEPIQISFSSAIWITDLADYSDLWIPSGFGRAVINAAHFERETGKSMLSTVISWREQFARAFDRKPEFKVSG